MALNAWVNQHKVYPEEARKRGESGEVSVRFTVDREGHVLDVALVRSAGSERLDAAAHDLLRGARLPSFPPEMSQHRVTVTMRIRFELAH